MSGPIKDGELLPGLNLPFKITIFTLILAVILGAALFTRLWRLDEPSRCYFDEVYFPTTGALYLRGDDAARNFFGSENTHPPLTKLFMALGQGMFGTTGTGEYNECWPDDEDADKRDDPDWLFEPFGWRFFGALFGAGAVLFIYLIAKRLFHSEIAGLAAGFILTFEGLALAQARIATPDSYVLFFMLGAIYFLIANRFLLSGAFLGAAMASKWNVGFALVPIALYFAWKLYRGIRETRREESLFRAESMMIGGLGILALGGAVLALYKRDEFVLASFDLLRAIARFDFSQGEFSDLIPAGPLIVAGVVVIYAGVASILADPERRRTARGRLYAEIAISFPVYFIAVPVYVYMLTYVPWVLQGGTVVEAIEQNRSAYDFHSSLETPHGYQSSFWEWPIMARPIFTYVGEGNAQIYSMANPWVYWLGIPAVVFAAFQGLRHFRARLSDENGMLTVTGRIVPGQAVLLFVVLGYLALWLPWALNPRTLFLYHYLPASAFMIVAMGYCVHWLWRNNVNMELVVGSLAAIAAFTINRLGHAGVFPEWIEYGMIGVGVFGVTSIAIGVIKLAQGIESPSPWRHVHWGQVAAAGYLAVIAGTFIYFYPHLTAMEVSDGLRDSFFWFDSWR